ncbi:Arginyl-tRNA--protein transferase 2 [Ananas comosus]|uniref:Arginyl-tRNA--protein transferase n=1 Tax=Ananas comosus TaxID=4615 RepID=A0A199V439_ANACO|nr:Arginyl-tRNA--protein transferase 2 [Ananas comosus]
MGDGASSSRGKGRGETWVIDQGRVRSPCGYCKSNTNSSISHELLDRGWRRSGCYLYKPEMERTCCPSYTIRLKASDFVPSKEQARVQKRMQRFLDDVKDEDSKDEMNRPNSSMNQATNASSSKLSTSSGKQSPPGTCENLCKDGEFLCYLADKIDSAINACFGAGEFPSVPQLPKAVVKKVSRQMKNKIMETDDLLYTSSISFQISAAIRKSWQMDEKPAKLGSSLQENQSEKSSDVSPKVIAEKLAESMEQDGGVPGFLTKACNGHLNFYSTVNTTSKLVPEDIHTQTSKGGCSKRSFSSINTDSLTRKRRKLEIRMKTSSFDPEEFALYRKYQIRVHNDEIVTENSYIRFLVDTPIIFVPPSSLDDTVPPCGLGSFHQQYLIDGKLVAVGVVDILPRCLSSKYLFWDPDVGFLSLGKYSALQEINWIKEMQVHCPDLQYYYLGYYIHTCSKMRYKAAYRPSELLCPLRYRWVPYDIARLFLDKSPYVVLSDIATTQDQVPLPQVSASPVDNSTVDCLDGSSDDVNEETGAQYEYPDAGVDDVHCREAKNVLLMGDSRYADIINNVVLDVNGSRVRFKELQQVFGPIKRRYIVELERKLHRYVKVVGKKLASRIIYSP